MKNLKKRLLKGEVLNGCWLNLGSSLTAEIIGQAGFDWVLIDLEHGSGNEKDAISQLQALESSKAGVVIRVESNDKRRIQRALDIGAEGVMVPQVKDSSDVRTAINGIYYSPDGERGVAKMVRATGFGGNFNAYREGTKENILGIFQIETKEALDNVEEIAGMDGVDILFVGPSDLTMSLGIFGQLEHPDYMAAINRIIAAAKKADKIAGILLFDPNDYQHFYDMGVRFFACGSDAGFVVQGAKQMAKALNSHKNANQ
ncbi:2-dehydro-3-deoxyglucarate aldolase [Flagellimonas olearia]|uniref:2-dehydro-3-deoxyglucarate aldolase n=1 Tax=Flagellimonas olearia TaxID=552546 RepID=A0A6I1E144_9FLAO|nr:aldolase/citrate lyase family protein [Allomuricauda olearia]KAB7531503.1 2-dehydro-3-deoxyglucarate aldolase [Allomuricauda olearia]